MEFETSHYIGIFLLIHVTVSIWALLKIFRSSMEAVCKTLWVPIVMFFPCVGVGAFLIFGRMD